MVFESHYFWFNQLIAWYIKHDYVFAKSKIFHHKKIEILSSIPESGLYVHSFLINFPAYLPESRKYDNMIVIVNYLSKKNNFSPCLITLDIKLFVTLLFIRYLTIIQMGSYFFFEIERGILHIFLKISLQTLEDLKLLVQSLSIKNHQLDRLS